MKTLFVAAVAAISMTGLAIAGEAKGPAVMTDAQMDLVVAGDLVTPGNTVFTNFTNPGGGGEFFGHPALTKRNAMAVAASDNNEGPWSAHFNSGGVVVCSVCGG